LRTTAVFDEALDDPGLDAVVLCTPSPQHADQVARCIERGLPVLVEMPLATDFARGRELADETRRRRLPVMVAMTHRFHGPLARLQRLIADGSVVPRSIAARYALMRRTDVGSSGYTRSWTDDLLWHHGHHSVDIVLWLLAADGLNQIEVTASASPADPASGRPFDIGIVLRTRAGQLATVALTYNSHIGIYDYLVTADDRTVVFEDGHVRTSDGSIPPDRDRLDSRTLQDLEFIDAVRDGRPPLVDPDAVLPAMQVLQAVQDVLDADQGRMARKVQSPVADVGRAPST
jgi:2-hydroxy-4-carboxymuconate semialdehyde hemiacetal dehydrogenase